MVDIEGGSSPNLDSRTCTGIQRELPIICGENLALGYRLARALSFSFSDYIQLIKQRRAFERTTTVATSHYLPGLGDGFIALRQATAIAQHIPEKRIIMFVHHSILELESLALPPNLELRSRFNGEVYNMPKDTFFLSLSPGLTGIETFTKATGRGGPEKSRFDPNKTYSEGKSSGPISSYYIYLNRVLKRGYRGGDIDALLPARLLGIPVTSADLTTPLFDRERLNQYPTNVDMVIAPDAGEGTSHDEQPQRSLKSLPISKWAEIAAQLPEGLSINVIIGKTHPEYSYAYFQAIHEQIPNSTAVVTPTLEDFVREAVRGRTYVGMDSGTTHTMSAVVKSLNPVGRTIKVKEILSSPYGDVEDELWRIRSVVWGQECMFEGRALHAMDPEQVAQFIMS